MRFVATKSAEQQAVLALHRTRELLVRQHHGRQRPARGVRRVRRGGGAKAVKGCAS
jgi:hypothetical protein